MNNSQATQFIKTLTADIQSKLSRKRSNAVLPLRDADFDAAAAINQFQPTGKFDKNDQDKACKQAFDVVIQYIIKVICMTFSLNSLALLKTSKKQIF